jgi:hypothetical protein
MSEQYPNLTEKQNKIYQAVGTVFTSNRKTKQNTKLSEQYPNLTEKQNIQRYWNNNVPTAWYFLFFC